MREYILIISLLILIVLTSLVALYINSQNEVYIFRHSRNSNEIQGYVETMEEYHDGVSIYPIPHKMGISSGICVGIRTYPKQKRWLSPLLMSFIAQHKESQFQKNIQLKLFIINTDDNIEPYTHPQPYIREIINNINTYPEYQYRHTDGRYLDSYIHLLTTNPNASQPSGYRDHRQGQTQETYGYYHTDIMLKYMTETVSRYNIQCGEIIVCCIYII